MAALLRSGRGGRRMAGPLPSSTLTCEVEMPPVLAWAGEREKG